MARILLAIFLISCSTLMIEVTMMRVFDVLLNQGMSYMIITCALFGFGLAGVYAAIRPLTDPAQTRGYLARLAVIFAGASLIILPLFNRIPFDFDMFDKEPLLQLVSFLAAYLVVIIPFFLSGLMFTTLFSTYASRIQALYFWDLVGAALGCVLLIPFIPLIAPGGLLFCTAGLGLFASALFAERRAWSVACVAVGIGLIVIPFVRMPEYIDFREHADKRGLRAARIAGEVEFTHWDPISKIDVHDTTELDPETGEPKPRSARKRVAYDGGSQTTNIYPFDGDFPRLRAELPDLLLTQFWQRGVLAAHYLREGTGSKVMIVGCAGGQEAKAAILMGASRIDAVELVETVVNLGKHGYAEYNGDFLNDPRVHLEANEGRAYLRSRDEKYDIIQIFSNHVTTSVAASGAIDGVYLQTVEAYHEYFDHLNETGILQVNNHVYPRYIRAAARAWYERGGTDFQRHVLAFERDRRDNLPSVLIKMTPWTAEEVAKLDAFFKMPLAHEQFTYRIVENPLVPEESFLPPEFYAPELPREVRDRAPYRVTAVTDDRPFYNFFRKSLKRVEADSTVHLNGSTAWFLNRDLKTGYDVPMDIVHLFVTGIVAIFYAVLFMVVPLRFSKVGRARWPGKGSSLTYFSCLGAGFIIIEIVFIQIFSKLIGFPLYTYSTVIFVMLLGAGLGSYASAGLGMARKERYWMPFAGVFVFGAIMWATYDPVFSMFLSEPVGIRCLVASVLIFPLAFFLGMPFPLGVLALQHQPRGAIAWGWGMNGLFTTFGGFLSVILTVMLGFRMTLVVAFLIYVLAMMMLRSIRAAAPASEIERAPEPVAP